MTTLADRIKTERLAKGLTQEALGKLVGVGKSSVSQWESGLTKHMDGTNLIATAKALNVNASWLATGNGDKILNNVRENDQVYYSVNEPNSKSTYPEKEKETLLQKFGLLFEHKISQRDINVLQQVISTMLDKNHDNKVN